MLRELTHSEHGLLLMITGLNHVNLAVADLQRSLAFYRDQLGCSVRAIWHEGAYLEVGQLWLCLSHEDEVSGPRAEYTHLAFSVSEADFAAMSALLRSDAVDPLSRFRR